MPFLSNFRARFLLSRRPFRLSAALLPTGALLFAALASPGRAQTLINPSFELAGGGFSGWTTAGIVSAAGTQTSSGGNVTPPAGSFQALFSSGDSATTTSTAAQLATFFGISALPSNAAGPPVDGSGIKQTFTSPATTLTFSFKYVTNESTTGTAFDEGFFVLDGVVTLLATASTSGMSSSNGSNGVVASFANGLSYQTRGITLTAGTHNLGFGVYNTGDNTIASGLLVDNLVFSIPEPAATGTACALAVAGGAVALRHRRRKSR